MIDWNHNDSVSFFSRKFQNSNQFHLLIVDFIYFLPERIFVEIFGSCNNMEVKKMPKLIVSKSLVIFKREN